MCPPNSGPFVGQILSVWSMCISLVYNELRDSNLVMGVTD